MRRIVALTFAIMLIASFFPSPAAAAADNKGPSCTDIKGRGGTIYKVTPDSTAPNGTAAFHFEFFIADTPCAFATYYLYVTDSAGAPLATATYPATAGNDILTLCGPTKFCYDKSFGTTPGAPTPISVSAATYIYNHIADSAPSLDYILCDTNTADGTYPDCPIGDNSWDQ